MENIQVQKKHQIAGNWDSRESNLVDSFDELDSILVTSNYAGIMVDSECRFTVYTRDDNIESANSIILVKGDGLRQRITNHFENTHDSMAVKPAWLKSLESGNFNDFGLMAKAVEYMQAHELGTTSNQFYVAQCRTIDKFEFEGDETEWSCVYCGSKHAHFQGEDRDNACEICIMREYYQGELQCSRCLQDIVSVYGENEVCGACWIEDTKISNYERCKYCEIDGIVQLGDCTKHANICIRCTENQGRHQHEYKDGKVCGSCLIRICEKIDDDERDGKCDSCGKNQQAYYRFSEAICLDCLINPPDTE